jgi:hypothetical protein
VLTTRKIDGKRTQGVKHVDILAPLGIGPPGLGPPDPSRLLALETTSDDAYDELDDTPVSVMSEDRTDMPMAAQQAVSPINSLITEPSTYPAPVEPYGGFGATRNADVEPRVVPDHLENGPSGSVNEQLAEIAKYASLRKVARRSGIRKVLPAQHEGMISRNFTRSVMLTL